MDDLISRKAAINIVNEYNKAHMALKGKPMLGAACILDELEDLPAAQPERETGKWMLNKEGNWACPFCEFDPYHDNMRGMNYCPNCGARLEADNGRDPGRL